MFEKYNLYRRGLGKVLILISSFSVLCNLQACHKEDIEIQMPKVHSENVSNVSSSSAVVGGTITNAGGTQVLERGIVFGTVPFPTVETSTKMIDSTSKVSFSIIITGLAISTKYYVRAYAKNTVGIGYGEDLFFTTSINLPTLTTNKIDLLDVTSNHALGSGSILNDGGGAIIEKGLVWSTSPAPTINNGSKVSDANQPLNFVYKLTGLLPLTTYYVRAYATNPVGTGYGNEESFTTLAKTFTFDLLFETTSLGTCLIKTIDGNYVTSRDKIVKLDTTGKVMWQTDVVNDGNITDSNVIQTKNHGYLVTNEVGLQKFDENGTAVWSYLRYGENSTAETETGEFLIVGQGATLAKIDKDGAPLWKKTPQFLTSDITEMINTYDGNFLIIGGWQTEELKITKIDTDGNLIWTKNYKSPFEIMQHQTIRCSNNSFLLGVSVVGPSNNYQNWILNIDTFGNKLWDQSLPLGYGSQLNSITQLSDGAYALVGYLYYTAYDPLYAFVVKLKQDGSKVWERQFSPDAQNVQDWLWSFSSVAETKDKGLIMLGHKNYVWRDSEPRGSWLLKTDLNGNVQ